MKYIGMIHFTYDQYEVTTATIVEEAKTILTTGFDYITEKRHNAFQTTKKVFRIIVINAGVLV